MSNLAKRIERIEQTTKDRLLVRRVTELTDAELQAIIQQADLQLLGISSGDLQAILQGCWSDVSDEVLRRIAYGVERDEQSTKAN